MKHNLLTLRFAGHITALSPISYASPDLDRKGPITMPKLGNRLYLTASSIRSIIRHGSSRAIYDVLGQAPSVDDYLLSAQGGVMNAKSGSTDMKDADDESDGATDEEKKASQSKEDKAVVLRMRFAREHNPMLTLFGSMAQGIPGALYCGHAFADESVSAETVRILRANDFRRDPGLLDELGGDAIGNFVRMQERAAIRSALKADQKSLKLQAAKARKAGASQDEMSAINEKIKDLDNKIKANPVVQLSMPSQYEVIPQGSTFEHDAVLSGVTPLEISLFMMGLREWAADPLIGGKRFHGLGRVSAEWSVTGRVGPRGSLKPMGSVSFAGDFGDLSVTGEIENLATDNLLRAAVAESQIDLSLASLVALD